MRDATMLRIEHDCRHRARERIAAKQQDADDEHQEPHGHVDGSLPHAADLPVEDQQEAADQLE